MTAHTASGPLRSLLQRRWIRMLGWIVVALDLGLVGSLAAHYLWSNEILPLHPALFVALVALLLVGIGFLAYRSGRDRSDAAAVKEALESEARLLTSQLRAAVWTTDTELRQTSVSGALLARLEAPELRVPGTTLHEVFGTRDVGHPVIAAHLRALRGESATYERAAGSIILEGRVEPLRNARGGVIGCVGFAVDITERRTAERQHRLLADALEGAGDLISVTDEENRFVYVNEAFLRTYGFTRDEVLGQTPAILGVPDSTAREILAQTMQGGWTGDVDNRRKDGAEVPVSLHTTLIRDSEGRVIGLLGVARDISGRRRADEVSSRYRALVESSQDAVIGLSLDASIESWNAGAERLYGYRAEEVIGRPFSMLVPPEGQNEVQIVLELVRKGHRVESYETERMGKDGRLVPVSVTASPIRDRAGRVVGLSGIHRDISVRKQADEVMRRLAAIVESSDDAILSTDAGRVIRTWNAGAERLYGYTAAEAVGKNIDALVLTRGAEAQAEVDAVAKRLARGAAVVRYEGRRMRKDGSLVEIAGTASEIRDASGALTGYSAIVRDITERQRAEEGLRQSEAMFRLLTENATDIVSRHAPDGTFLYVSPACRRLLGYDPEELVGRSAYEFIHPDDAAGAPPPRDPAAAYSVTFRYRRKDGTYAWFESLGRALRDRTTGAVAEFQAVSRDVTDRMLAEQQLRRQGENLRALARHLDSVREEEHTRIAREIHDGLGQSLTALRLDLTSLARRFPEARADVRQKIGAMIALADGTIEAARSIVAELRPPILDDLGLAPSLEWYVHRFAKRAGLRCEWNPGPAELFVDREVAVIAYRIVQEALTNVARHAKARHVAVRLGEVNGALTVEIRDDGRGITDDAATSPRSLGIVGMRERALTRGGSLEISRLPEGGTSVRVTIPPERRREPTAPR